MQVMAGNGIQQTRLTGVPTTPLIWAMVYSEALLPTPYMLYLLREMGTDMAGIVTILYAKPSYSKQSSHRTDRQTMNQKSTSDSSLTVIFSSTRHLRGFINTFKRFVSDVLPDLLVGHSEQNIQPDTTVPIIYDSTLLTLDTYMAQTDFMEYLSNHSTEGHDYLESESSILGPPPTCGRSPPLENTGKFHNPNNDNAQSPEIRAQHAHQMLLSLQNELQGDDFAHLILSMVDSFGFTAEDATADMDRGALATPTKKSRPSSMTALYRTPPNPNRSTFVLGKHHMETVSVIEENEN
jgi:hypothetical protein